MANFAKSSGMFYIKHYIYLSIHVNHNSNDIKLILNAIPLMWILVIFKILFYWLDIGKELYASNKLLKSNGPHPWILK